MPFGIISRPSQTVGVQMAGGYSGTVDEPVVLDTAYDVKALDLSTEMSGASLPILATGNDIREVVRSLKYKTSGVTVIEAMNAEPRRIFDARKIAAYEFWGIVERSGERLRLTGLGRELAESIEPECAIYRRILRSTPAYLGALQFFYQQKLEIVSRADAAKYWMMSHPELKLDQLDEKNVEAIAVSFFSICHAADLGTTTIGKRGQPARLRIDREKVRNLLERPYLSQNVLPLKKLSGGPRVEDTSPSIKPAESGRVYLSIGTNGNEAAETALGDLHTALELADFDDLIYCKAIIGAEFLPPSQLDEIQKCRAAVFLLDASSCTPTPNGGTGLDLCGLRLAEISVARALLAGRVVVLWSERDVAPPESLRQMNVHFLTCEKFDWETGASLVKLLKSLWAESSAFRPIA